MAVSAGVNSYLRFAQIIIGRVSLPPMTKSATIRSSKEVKNANTAEEMIAGRMEGGNRLGPNERGTSHQARANTVQCEDAVWPARRRRQSGQNRLWLGASRERRKRPAAKDRPSRRRRLSSKTRGRYGINAMLPALRPDSISR